MYNVPIAHKGYHNKIITENSKKSFGEAIKHALTMDSIEIVTCE